MTTTMITNNEGKIHVNDDIKMMTVAKAFGCYPESEKSYHKKLYLELRLGWYFLSFRLLVDF